MANQAKKVEDERTIHFRGGRLPVRLLSKYLDDLWAERLARLHFRIRPYVMNPGGEPIDLNQGATNEEICEILRMPKVGVRLCYGEAVKKIYDACCDADGELVDLSPCMWNPAKWAKENGYYIEFDDGELEVA